MGSRIERSLDATDWRILDELQADGRLSWNQLGRLVSLSPPAVAERVRRLEELGVIAGYQARVDPARAGLPLTAFVQMRCRLDRCLLKTSQAGDYPEIVEIHKLTGDYCSMLKVRAGVHGALRGAAGARRPARRDAHLDGAVDPVRGPPGPAPVRRVPPRHPVPGLEPTPGVACRREIPCPPTVDPGERGRRLR